MLEEKSEKKTNQDIIQNPIKEAVKKINQIDQHNEISDDQNAAENPDQKQDKNDKRSEQRVDSVLDPVPKQKINESASTIQDTIAPNSQDHMEIEKEAIAYKILKRKRSFLDDDNIE
ncbi:hypothetical protein OnM2_108011 [Erysiphe neolycopersici]|uniref:Uncharacterized protein n=1 Tax=Erysiphe neolycopersici TaxID=212602 RepID=A0A420H6Q4_9PEZI|nr:hypothetical protein OnM2_108011 [Erysiphe neolycopersici]